MKTRQTIQLHPWIAAGLLLAALCLFGAAAAAVRGPAILRGLVLEGISKAAGVKAEAAEIQVDLRHGSIRVSGLRLSEPEGFPAGDMFEIPSLYVDLDIPSLLRGRKVAERMILDIENLHVVKNGAGLINLQELPEGSKPMRIRRLDLRIGTIVYHDYTMGREPIVQRFPVSIEKQYADIDGLGHLHHVIGTAALTHAAVRRLIPLNPGKFIQSNIFDPMTVANKYLSGAASNVGDTAINTAEAVFGGLKATTGRLADAVIPGGPGPSAEEEPKKQ